MSLRAAPVLLAVPFLRSGCVCCVADICWCYTSPLTLCQAVSHHSHALWFGRLAAQRDASAAQVGPELEGGFDLPAFVVQDGQVIENP